MEPHCYNHLKDFSPLNPPQRGLAFTLKGMSRIGLTLLRKKKEVRKDTKTHFKKVFGQLVLLGYDISAFTPAAYQRCSLQRPYVEI